MSLETDSKNLIFIFNIVQYKYRRSCSIMFLEIVFKLIFILRYRISVYFLFARDHLGVSLITRQQAKLLIEYT